MRDAPDSRETRRREAETARSPFQTCARVMSCFAVAVWTLFDDWSAVRGANACVRLCYRELCPSEIRRRPGSLPLPQCLPLSAAQASVAVAEWIKSLRLVQCAVNVIVSVYFKLCRYAPQSDGRSLSGRAPKPPQTRCENSSKISDITLD